MATTPHQQQAAYLAELWHRLSAQHIALGCSCTMSGISVTLEDFERDIADYLWAESERLGQAAVVAFLLAPGPVSEQVQAVRGILARLEADEAEDAVAEWLLARLTKTIESYAKLHGPAPEAPLLGGSNAWRKGYRA
ncbi:hypothetical protein ACT80S_03240 [Ramlibacter sp. MAHUQ-53]|uniref:hypothetical protein n=1 Tax=unclassified Ramlibacter TaxID=2617605 RepID=UPI003634EED3